MLIGSSCGNAFASSAVDDVVLRLGGRGVFSSGNAADSILVEAVVPSDVGGEVIEYLYKVVYLRSLSQDLEHVVSGYKTQLGVQGAE